MEKRKELIDIVRQYPRRTAREYATLTQRPHASVRRDLSELAVMGIVERVWAAPNRTRPLYWRVPNRNVAPDLTRPSLASL